MTITEPTDRGLRIAELLVELLTDDAGRRALVGMLTATDHGWNSTAELWLEHHHGGGVTIVAPHGIASGDDVVACRDALEANR